MTALPVELLTLGSISVPIFNKERYVKVTVFNKFRILTNRQMVQYLKDSL